MDGLLGSEFALVLRDSFKHKPRRHAVSHLPPASSPLSSALPSPPTHPASSQHHQIRPHHALPAHPQIHHSQQQQQQQPRQPSSLPQKKPRVSGADLGIRCDMQLEPRLSFTTIPTSPTSPVPLQSAQHHPSPVRTHRPIPMPVLLDPPPMRGLDVLASVSAEARALSNIPPSSPVEKKPKGVEKKKKKRTAPPGGRVFACTMCKSTFSQQFNLNKHVRAVHERRRPFECEICHAKFQQRSHRTMHRLAVHEKLRQFVCDRCGASFSWRGVLKKHRKSIHGIDE